MGVAGYDSEWNTADVTGTKHPGHVAYMQLAFLNAAKRADGTSEGASQEEAFPGLYGRESPKPGGTIYLIQGLESFQDLPPEVIKPLQSTLLVGVQIKNDLSHLLKRASGVSAAQRHSAHSASAAIIYEEMSSARFHEGKSSGSLAAMLSSADLMGGGGFTLEVC